ncbi:MAG: DNA cytosine methyltransferase [Acidobacteria bacterium]|nr:DNA cytosine methyltransferase [Acidobacteriota bacterium]
MKNRIAVVDLFAGPGGLAEGFSAVETSNGFRPFRVALSIEKDSAAHSTLLLRTFLRQFESGFPNEYYSALKNCAEEPRWAELYPVQWDAALREARQIELGSPAARKEIPPLLAQIKRTSGGNTVLIGGPPCQAYSLVGRARNKGIKDYIPEEDHRHFLYKEYLRILRQLEPLAFVMENVKGFLSASIGGDKIFTQVLADLRSVRGHGGYELFALSADEKSAFQAPAVLQPSDFIVRAEYFGIPQARHRVIVVGIRGDIAAASKLQGKRITLPTGPRATLSHVLDGMPKLRSALSKDDSPAAWTNAVREAAVMLSGLVPARFNTPQLKAYKTRLRQVIATLRVRSNLPRFEGRPAGVATDCPKDLKAWLRDPRVSHLSNHGARSHMASDLARYLFAGVYSEILGSSPKAEDFPDALAPAHKNWKSGKFRDRFTVQTREHPSSTITSHISKDGHFFIHPDPEQCRSLTVREAARLQTFPDNYVFKGNRTEQFVQVGNAVPPYLARQIGDVVYRMIKEHATHGGTPDRHKTRVSR